MSEQYIDSIIHGATKKNGNEQILKIINYNVYMSDLTEMRF